MGRKLPKNPEKGKKYKIRVNSSGTNIGEDRIVTFKATGKKGFGKYKIVSNDPVSKSKSHTHRRS